MRKLKTLIILIISVLAGSLIGCSGVKTQPEAVQEPVNEVVEQSEEVETVQVEEDSEMIKALKAKYNYQDATEFITSTGQSMMLKTNNEYTYNILNKIDEETGIETIVEFESNIHDNTIYHIKMYEIPIEQREFLLKNPLRIADTKNESTNTFIDLICVDNKETDTKLNVMDSEGNEHKVIKYEVNLDMTILGIENLNLHRETPTYYAIENGKNYIGMLVTEEVLSEDDPRLLELRKENIETSVEDEVIDKRLGDTETVVDNTEDITVNEDEITVSDEVNTDTESKIEVDKKSDTEIIIESSLTEDEKAEEETKHAEEVSEVYNELDTKTQNHIEVIKSELIKKDLGSAEEQEKRLVNIDKIAFEFISNIMLGRFDKY